MLRMLLVVSLLASISFDFTSSAELCTILKLREMQVAYDNCTVMAMENQNPCQMLDKVMDT